MLPPFRSRPALLGVLLLIGLLAACSSSPDSTEATGSTGSVTPSTSTSSVPGTTDPVPEGPATITPYWLREGTFVAAGIPRPVPPGADPARFAIDALLSRPTPVEDDAGLTTGHQTNVVLTSLTMEGSTAVVDFGRTFETHDTQPQVAQVIFTLTQFPEIAKVRFLIDGKTNGATGVPPMDRSNVAKNTPAVLPELPAPGGATEDGKLKTTGSAAIQITSIPWKLEGADGPPLAEGTLEVKPQPGDTERGRWFALLDVPPPTVYEGPAWLTLAPAGLPPVIIPVTL